MNFDSKCVKLEKDLVTVINNAALPIGAVTYILKTVLNTAERQLDEACRKDEIKENENGAE